jgi:hypothetical protein
MKNRRWWGCFAFRAAGDSCRVPNAAVAEPALGFSPFRPILRPARGAPENQTDLARVRARSHGSGSGRAPALASSRASSSGSSACRPLRALVREPLQPQKVHVNAMVKRRQLAARARQVGLHLGLALGGPAVHARADGVRDSLHFFVCR